MSSPPYTAQNDIAIVKLKQHDTLVSCDLGQSEECFIDFIRNSTSYSTRNGTNPAHDVL